MLVHVRTPHTDFTVEGIIPNELLVKINDAFGDDYLEKAENMNWYKRAQQLEQVGENLKFYRERCGLTQTQLSEKTGVSKQLISMIERNKTAISKNNAMAFSKFFDVPLSQFLK